jgi:hypothetical protein
LPAAGAPPFAAGLDDLLLERFESLDLRDQLGNTPRQRVSFLRDLLQRVGRGIRLFVKRRRRSRIDDRIDRDHVLDLLDDAANSRSAGQHNMRHAQSG